MPNAIRIHELGGPEVLSWEEITVGEPGPGEVRLRQTAVGLNFIDVYFRTGLYKAPALPFIPGLEGAGVVEAVGAGVDTLAVGDRVAYATQPLGAYAEARVMAADRLVKVPDSVDDNTAAAMMLQGMTAQYLLRQTYPVQAGQTILFHAVAGGVGLIACQWAKHLGATVIGTVGSEAKAELARAHGCDHTINYKSEDFVARVREITEGRGVPVVYDSVGKDTFMKSLECLSPRGMLVSFGQSSGAVAPLDPGILSARGSLYLTRPTLFTYTAKPEDLQATARELFEVVGAGHVKIEVNQHFPLRDAAEAHRALEARRTTGSSVLTV
ncbi:quinone oxidoreductase family protein [Thioalbus denitrificans]|uniref:NADPH:quinone reductase n=1 Tax=Thioalbus denitrificans TaxID=547122 RepID=A0A369BXQ8_9GAMM|nr:quinone oxidoreductase [Thioalbus denitrificans]RCX26490.1 NADPH2:quinone reductase [Thioalbus denitrificans]